MPKSFRKRIRIGERLVKAAFAGFFVLAIAVTANAYTLVFRDGRKVEIPVTFTVTNTTVTYELAPGFSRTVALVLIDVPATERANHEQPGAFHRHAEAGMKSVPQHSPRARVTLTNNDFKAVERRRIESERAYEQRRIELGLPSVEETRKRQDEAAEELRIRFRAKAEADARDEMFWRDRARILRAEIAAVDAQMNLLRSQLAGLRQFPLETHSLVISALPLVPLATRSAMAPPAWGFGSPPGRFGPNATRFHGAPHLRGLAQPGAGFSFGAAFNPGFSFGTLAGPFDYVEDSYLRANLSNRFEDLLLMRAGLSARWRLLEDEARDARVPQIWLEP